MYVRKTVNTNVFHVNLNVLNVKVIYLYHISMFIDRMQLVVVSFYKGKKKIKFFDQRVLNLLAYVKGL